jgi:hypothetical protein
MPGTAIRQNNGARSLVRSFRRAGPPPSLDPERQRVDDLPWRRWGPYLAERQWGTVREDYSAEGDPWRSFPFDHARSRAFRWGEDGLFSVSDDGGRLCLALGLWNEADSILKERLFGLSGPEGNHGEDVKEVYWYLDATPTASYLRARLPISAARVSVRSTSRREREPHPRRP